MMKHPARLMLAILVVMALAEFIPEVVNSFLILLLVGILLGHWVQFQWLTKLIGSIGE
jgi:hypothetical protein